MRSFAMIWRPWLGPLQLQIADRLMDEGWVGTLYVARAEYIPGISLVGSTSKFERVVPFQVLYDVATQPCLDEKFEIERATKLEAQLGLTFGELMLTDRHFGRGFALAGSGFPTSGASMSSLGQTYSAISAQLEFWLDELKATGASLFLDADVFSGKVAESLSVRIRNICASRHGDYYYFSHDVIMRTPMLHVAYRNLPQGVVHSGGVVQAKAVQDFFKTAYREAQAFFVLKWWARRVAEKIYGLIRRRSANSGYKFGSEIFYMWRQRSNIRRMMRSPAVSLESLGTRRVVYFPLATEPEFTLQVLSQQYFFQMETIAALARDMPADVILVVKEHHPACGARNAGFYDQILSFKNLRMLDLRTPGLDAVRRADVVVTIAGSAGFEAATMGKPTIVLGRNNLYDFLPHVRVVRDIAFLRESLNDALEGRLAGNDAVANGMRFLRAVEAISFRAEDFDAYDQKVGIPDHVGDAAFACLMRSLRFDDGFVGPSNDGSAGGVELR